MLGGKAKLSEVPACSGILGEPGPIRVGDLPLQGDLHSGGELYLTDVPGEGENLPVLWGR